MSMTGEDLSPFNIVGLPDITSAAMKRTNTLDRMLSDLKDQFTWLFSVPLTKERATKLYSPNTTLLLADDNAVLSTRDDLVATSQALVAALYTVPRLPTPLVRLLGSSAASLSLPFYDLDLGALLLSDRVSCKVALVVRNREITTSPSEETIWVDWQWRVLKGESSSSNISPELALKGLSELTLNLERQHVISHRIHTLRVNDASIPPLVVAQTLKTMRTSYLDMQKVPLVNNWLQEASVEFQVAEKNKQVGPLDNIFFAVNETLVNSGKLHETSRWTPVDEFPSPTPLAGSNSWRAYKRVLRSLHEFVNTTLPILSGQEKETTLSVFTADSCLLDANGDVLLSSNLQEFYVSLAEWRVRTFATWELEQVTALKWDEATVEVRVDYFVPNVSSRGSDMFTLTMHPQVRIMQVQQQSLTVGAVQSSWLAKSIVKSFEADRAIQLSSNLWDGLLSPNRLSLAPPTIPTRSDAAGLRVYRLMESLHNDVAVMFHADVTVVPGMKHLDKNVVLSGYFGSTILKGRETYTRSFSLLIQGVSQAINGKRIRLLQEPSVSVEFTPRGQLLCLLQVELDLSPLLSSLPPLAKPAAKYLTNFDLRVQSQYKLSPSSGKIVCHELTETRINGQLAPADLLVRALQRPDKQSPTQDNWISLMKDVMELVKSM